MLVRLGYVAMSLELKDCSPSKTITVKHLENIKGEEARLGRLRRITAENLNNCIRLLYHNKAHNIRVFRFTSKFVPLATHPLAAGWDYTEDLRDEFARIGQIVLDNEMRVSSHPDHYTLINSPKEEVIEASFKDLEYHDRIFTAMGLENAEMVMHVGGLYGSKETAINRFINNFRKLPAGIKKRLRLENDDKSFTASDVLHICREIKIPMVLDVHHHQCINNGEDIGDILPEVFATWEGKLPKVHFSSPRSEQNCRAHADDIEIEPFCNFLYQATEVGTDFDVMIEAKNKDIALFNVMKGLEKVPAIKIMDQASVIL